MLEGYEALEVEVIRFDAVDVIKTSGENETPIIGG